MFDPANVAATTIRDEDEYVSIWGPSRRGLEAPTALLLMCENLSVYRP